LFSIGIVALGVARADPAARGAPVLFRLIILPGVIAFVGAFFGVSILFRPVDAQISPLILILRGTGVCAIVLLHFIL